MATCKLCIFSHFITIGSIGDEGGSAIASGLSSNKSIRMLNLRSNKLEDGSALQFADALRRFVFRPSFMLIPQVSNSRGIILGM